VNTKQNKRKGDAEKQRENLPVDGFSEVKRTRTVRDNHGHCHYRHSQLNAKYWCYGNRQQQCAGEATDAVQYRGDEGGQAERD
jgi:ribosomal protein L39E